MYFSRCNWGQLHILTINDWQTILRGLFLLPLAIYFYDGSKNNYTGSLIFCIAWLAIPVCIVAALVMNEPLSWFTLAGVIFVVGGLYLVQKQKRAAGT